MVNSAYEEHDSLGSSILRASLWFSRARRAAFCSNCHCHLQAVQQLVRVFCLYAGWKMLAFGGPGLGIHSRLKKLLRKDERFISEEVLSFPYPFAWYLCKSPTLSRTLSFGKAHSDISISLSNQTLSGEGGTQCQARGEKKASTSSQQETFCETTVCFCPFSLF